MTRTANSSTVWNYVAMGKDRSTQRGVLTGETGAEVRAQLRKKGLTPMRVRAKRISAGRLAVIRQPLDSYLRSRRQAHRARLYESLATLHESGLSLHESLGTLNSSARKRSRALSSMLIPLASAIEQGQPLSGAMAAHPRWFGLFEVAMVSAGQARGELASVLRGLADRERQAGELSAKLVGALAYPMLVAAVGVVVVVVLSTKALPELVGVLDSAGVETPRLTESVMSIGQVLAGQGPVLMVALILAGMIGAVSLAATRSRGVFLPSSIIGRMPEVVRKLRSAAVSVELAELVRCGVPLPEALRVVSQTQRGLLAGGLGRDLTHAADRIDEGEPLSGTIAGSVWFDPEHARLIEIGETSGELGDILDRLGRTELRAAQRAVDRFTSMIQPAAILSLAVLIGVVVMSAIQPIVKLREIIG